MYYDIKKIIDETISEVFYFAKSKQIDIELQVNENILAYFDKNTIKTAIRNILSNSIKFTNPGGKITVSAFDENKHIKIIFKDNGIGMSKDKIESILRDENVKSQEGTNKEKGFGLGLYLCKEFIAKNKGTLQIFSEPKVGTTIEIILPQFSPMDLREV
jgi:signal transduction histidine kinase